MSASACATWQCHWGAAIAKSFEHPFSATQCRAVGRLSHLQSKLKASRDLRAGSFVSAQGATSGMLHNVAEGRVDTRLPSSSLGDLMQVVLLEKAYQPHWDI